MSASPRCQTCANASCQSIEPPSWKRPAFSKFCLGFAWGKLMPIVLISESLLRRSTATDGCLLRESVLFGFCLRMNRRKRSYRIASNVAGKQFPMRTSQITALCFAQQFFLVDAAALQSRRLMLGGAVNLHKGPRYIKVQRSRAKRNGPHYCAARERFAELFQSFQALRLSIPHRASAWSSAVRASTQRAPWADCSFFQNGAWVLR